MYSLAQSFKTGLKKGQAPINEYEWKDRIFGKVGIKRVETKRFIRFEHLSIRQKENWYWYSSRSHWFIKVPFCKNDKQILTENIIFLFITVQATGSIIFALLSLVS